ncbi:tyrosine recombinase [Marivirga tractuosa]|uniref:Integrase family protein n=1 Tax=Marivirga tractuosa (strain ATCC 23168 / DSM 4126 / NBRC 15989 / NCIMB 1408 / VKM B-1430 / H-43) TaxID=643867 RepID=E4TLX3_MARTH|nr:site-specific integrase [Marivirga tractuosa]ADR20264.1 integrase family protein [Marivirga tractuosa DSM 4126]BDD15294.1 tyrosine recombinase [Marivirga tractuosa]
MLKTSVSVTLDKRRPKKNGFYPIIFRLNHYDKNTSISSKHDIDDKYWDFTNKKVKKGCPQFSSTSAFNNFLVSKLSDFSNEILRLESLGRLESMSIQDVKKAITRDKKDVQFYAYTTEWIEDLKNTGRKGYARTFDDLIRELKIFTENKDFSFRELNYEFLKKFDTFYLSRGTTSLNSLAVYMRSIRVICNRAIKDGIMDEQQYPFKNYQIRTTPTAKRAIDFKYLEKIIELDLEPSNPLFHVRNYFLLSFYLQGRPFIDLVYLEKKFIKNGRLKFFRTKTNQPLDIKLSPQVQEIVDYYKTHNPDSDYILPVLTKENEADKRDQYQHALGNYNKKLKKLAKLVGIQESLTSYVARHSFATIANNMGLSVSAISQMLAHTSIKTTQVYLDKLKASQLDHFTDRIIRGGK